MQYSDTLLIEIGTEELPPRQLGRLAQAFAAHIKNGLASLGLECQESEDFASPRRIAVKLKGLSSHQADRLIQKKGPSLAAAFDSTGKPTPAALGFAKSCQVEITALKHQETPQGSWLIFEQAEQGKPLATLLPSLITEALQLLPAKKRMRWSDQSVEFLRPIHWIVVIHGSTPLPMEILGITAGNTTYGHRVHAPQPIVIDHADNYLEILRNAKVMADYNERTLSIKQAITSLAEQQQANAVIDPDLLDEVSGLVEWVVPVVAHFDRAFLAIPAEALISSMQNHQKCFPLKDQNGNLLPFFILISNISSKNPEIIIQGNERVMRARLADAKFFFEQDKKTPLANRLEGLKNMVFQQKLGTLYDKSQRIAKLATNIAKQIGANSENCERAATLCKADLLTEMVFEFPELQGIMGRYYAEYNGENKEVACAIEESYLPRFAKDVLPTSTAGICLALADRLDTLVGIFSIGQTPTGDKDPFGLRRQAVAILRIIIENQLPLDLAECCEIARQGYQNVSVEIVSQVVAFCFERFKAWYLEQGLNSQTLEAVLTLGVSKPFEASCKVLAVQQFQTLNEAHHLATANKRVKNILEKNNVAINLQALPAVRPELLQEEAETALFKAIQILQNQTAPLITSGKFQEALKLLASLQQPLDAFFEHVMVMTDEQALKQNRIHLLGHLRALFMQIADISRLAL